MVYFFSSLFSYISSIIDARTQQRRAASAAQQVQQPAQQFAAAWNRAGGPEPLRATVQDPVRGPVVFFPVCDAAMSDDGTHLYITLTVRPDGPLSTDDISTHTEDVRQAVRIFFQVAVRLTGMDVRQCAVTLVYEPVQPMLNSEGASLVGFSASGRPLYLPFIGEVTAITGGDSDAATAWIGAAYGMVEQRAVPPEVAASSTEAVARQARHGAVPPYQLLALGDAVCPENRSPTRIDTKTLALARRGLIESSLADVEPDRWAVRPSLTIRCDGDTCIVEKAGRSLKFTPAWRY